MTVSSDESDRKRNIGNYFEKKKREILFVRSFTTSSAEFSEFDSRNMILLQIKVFGRNIKETTLATYSLKLTARSTFTD